MSKQHIKETSGDKQQTENGQYFNCKFFFYYYYLGYYLIYITYAKVKSSFKIKNPTTNSVNHWQYFKIWWIETKANSIYDMYNKTKLEAFYCWDSFLATKLNIYNWQVFNSNNEIFLKKEKQFAFFKKQKIQNHHGVK